MLQEGDIIQLSEGQVVYTDVPAHFVYESHKGDFTLVRGTVKIAGELSYFAGRYVVYKTTEDGGSEREGYRDGHHVYCERLDGRGHKVDFYQSGSFTAMNPELRAVAKAQRVWVDPRTHQKQTTL